MRDGHDARASALVLCSRGAPPDPLNFYSTTTSSTHRDWLPVFRARLHRSVPAAALIRDATNAHASAANPVDFATDSQAERRNILKQQTGFTKNSLSHVEYDPKVDESDYKFLSESFKTTHALAFDSPAKPNNDAFAKSEFVAQEIIDSGFTRLPKHRVTDQGRHYPLGQSEMKSMFLASSHTLRGPSVDKSKIVPSSSAFTSDTGHISSLGTETTSPFAKPPTSQIKQSNDVSDVVFPSKMDQDGFTRSGTHRILDSVTNPPGILPNRTLETIQHSNPTRWMMMHENGKSTSNYVHTELHPMDETMSLRKKSISIGPKQEAGSVRNNLPFVEKAESAPAKRFLTETQDRFTRPTEGFRLDKFTCDSMSRSGFTSSNKFGYTFPVKDHKEFLASLHPTVAAYRQRQEAHVLATKPTNNPRLSR